MKKNDIKKRAVLALRILYPLWTVIGMFSLMYVPSVVGDDIAGGEMLLRAGVVGSIITQLIHIVVVYFLYQLFITTDKRLAILLIFFGLLGVPLAMLNELNVIAALYTVNNPELAGLFLEINKQGIVIASVFWGLWLFPLGLLVKRSGYFPKVIGNILLAAGMGYLLGSFVDLLFIGNLLQKPNMFSSAFEILTFGEVVFMLYVVIRGAKLS